MIDYFHAENPHTGVGYLVAMLKRHNIPVKIVDMRLGYSMDELCRIVDKFEPQIVGVTSYSFGYKRAYEIIERIKACEDVKVVVGGPHATAVKGSLLEETKADFVVKGEGEFTLIELCNAIESGIESYKNIKGLIWREGSNIVENPDRPFIQDLDSLPYPAFEQFELEKYLCHDAKRLPIITSRGCPFRCNFCSVHLLMGRRFRPRSPENVVNEMQYWYKKGWRRFDINDDNFTLDRARAEKICDLIVKRGLKTEYRLWNGIRVDRVNEELLRKMKQSGAEYIAYGVESGNNEVLRRIGKGITIEKARESIELTNKIGIKCAVFFIIGHPGETYEKALDTIKFAESIPNQTNFFNLVPYPGTKLYNWVMKNATLLYPPEVYLNEISHDEYGNPEKPIFEVKEFPVEQRKRLLRRAFLLTRKKSLETSIGKQLGDLAYVFLKSDRPWELLMRISGSRKGKKLLRAMKPKKSQLTRARNRNTQIKTRKVR